MSGETAPEAVLRRPVRLGIDAGSYGSGYGWCVVAPEDGDLVPRQITRRSQWPGAPTESPKTLTRLLLDPAGHVVAWGHDARRRAEVSGARGKDAGFRLIESIKMYLGRRKDTADGVTSLSCDMGTEPPERLLALFLTKIYRTAVDDIARSGFTEDQIQVCITVPAVFSDHQKQMVRHAAHEAGISWEEGALILALEPEAAAQYARVSGVRVGAATEAAPIDLTTPGTRFVVADCGGGTVDVTGYRSEEDGMIEIGKVRGAWRGSMYLDTAFENLVLKPRFGGEKSYERLLQKCPEAIRSIRDTWERAKQEITVGHSEPLYLQIPAVLSNRISTRAKRDLKIRQGGEANQVIITPEEIEEVFAQVVPRVVEIIDEQVALIQAEYGTVDQGENILLVGGFAGSPYLQQSLINHFAGRGTVLIPPDPAGAVLTGAVHFACNPDVRCRRVRYTYGIRQAMEFESGVDPENKRVDAYDGARCGSRFNVFAAAGEIVSITNERTGSCLPLWVDQTGATVEIYRSTKVDPRYVDEPGVEYIGSVKVDLKPVMGLDMERRSFRLGINFGETELKVRAFVDETGERVEASFDFEKLESLGL